MYVYKLRVIWTIFLINYHARKIKNKQKQNRVNYASTCVIYKVLENSLLDQ